MAVVRDAISRAAASLLPRRASLHKDQGSVIHDCGKLGAKLQPFRRSTSWTQHAVLATSDWVESINEHHHKCLSIRSLFSFQIMNVEGVPAGLKRAPRSISIGSKRMQMVVNHG